MASSSKRALSDCGLVAPLNWFSDEEIDEAVHIRGGGATADVINKKPRFDFTTEREIDNLSVAKPPKTTAYSTSWALRNYEAWQTTRNSAHPELPVPDNLLTSGSEEDLNHWLSFYIVETKKSNGESYPPKTLYQLLTGLLRHSRSRNSLTPNFLDKANPAFKSFHHVLDNTFKSLRQEGVGSGTKHAEIITKEEEQKLWESGVMGIGDPKSLLRAIFYYNGKNFCLRGGQEHRQLKLSQFVRLHTPCDHYIYTENSSKNRSGGFAQLHLENKVVPIFHNPDADNRCHVKLLDLYISKLPNEVTRSDYFYARPLTKVPTDPLKPWFAASPVGKNILATMIKEMCSEANIQGHKTNHSLRATGASELFEAGVPEKIIKERTGHRSLEALRVYERTTFGQQQAVSTVLSAEKKTSFQEALHLQQSSRSMLQCEPSMPYHPLQQAGQPHQFFNNCSFSNCSVMIHTPATAVPARSVEESSAVVTVSHTDTSSVSI